MKDDSNGHIQQIELERIHPSPTNPRKTFNADGLNELAETIKSQGVLQPILLRPMPGWRLVPGGGSNGNGKGYRKGFLWENLSLKLLGGFVDKEADGETTRPLEIVAGERRFRACKLAKLETIPAIVREMTDRQVLEIQMIENEQREDVLPSERAAAYRRLHQSGTPVEAIAAQIGKSVSTVRNLLALGRLPISVIEPMDTGKISLSVATLLARIPGEAAREKATAEVIAGDWESNNEPMSYRHAKAHIGRQYTVELKQAPFSQADRKLLPSAGSCKDCPKRVGNLAKEDPEGYAGARADVCTDPECYRAKCDAHNLRESQKLTKEGIAFAAKTGFEMRLDHVALDEKAEDLLRGDEEDEDAAYEALPTWGEALKGRLDGERVATRDRDGRITIWVPEDKALELVCPEKAQQEAKGKASLANGQSGPAPWDIERKARELAETRTRETLLALCRNVRLDAHAGQLIGLLAAHLAEEELEYSPSEIQGLCKRHGIAMPSEYENSDAGGDEDLAAVRKWLDDAADSQALAVVADLMVMRAWACRWHSRGKDGIVKDLLAVAGLSDASAMKALDKEAKAALKAEVKAKKSKPKTPRQEMEGDDAPEEEPASKKPSLKKAAQAALAPQVCTSCDSRP